MRSLLKRAFLTPKTKWGKLPFSPSEKVCLKSEKGRKVYFSFSLLTFFQSKELYFVFYHCSHCVMSCGPCADCESISWMGLNSFLFINLSYFPSCASTPSSRGIEAVSVRSVAARLPNWIRHLIISIHVVIALCCCRSNLIPFLCRSDMVRVRRNGWFQVVVGVLTIWLTSNFHAATF